MQNALPSVNKFIGGVHGTNCESGAPPFGCKHFLPKKGCWLVSHSAVTWAGCPVQMLFYGRRLRATFSLARTVRRVYALEDVLISSKSCHFENMMLLVFPECA